MKVLGFLPVLGGGSRPQAREPVRAGADGPPLDLLLGPEGSPRLAPASQQAGESLAVLRGQPSSAGVVWWLVARSPALAVNGSRPLPLTALQPGDLVTVGADVCWLVVEEWAASPSPAPPELAGRPCPVCGGELGCAPVCRCVCGCYAHLEEPGAPDPAKVLNCYLSGPCSLCGRRPTLEPVLVPEPSEKLLGPDEPMCVGRAGPDPARERSAP
jgi:hypothetical protein